MQEAYLKAKLSKCDFFKLRIEFLGHPHTGYQNQCIQVISDSLESEEFSVLPRLCWLLQSLFHNFAAIASPLTRLLKKSVPFIWKDAQRHAFESMKHALIHTPILAFPNYILSFTLCTDASTLVVGAVNTIH